MDCYGARTGSAFTLLTKFSNWFFTREVIDCRKGKEIKFQFICHLTFLFRVYTAVVSFSTIRCSGFEMGNGTGGIFEFIHKTSN
jgi:hypothetical protein